MSIMGILAMVVLLYWLAMLALASRGLQHMHELPTAAPPADRPADKLPLVSVILAAKEEEGTIMDTVRHLLSQTYPRLEIIAVNDRSQDRTGRRLEELRQWSADKRQIRTPLQIIHITQLPQGWLGKNHALYQGYLQAKGQYLLFTDADIRFAPTAIADAMSYVRANGIQHLTLAPDMIAKSRLLRCFVNLFLLSFSLFVQPWRANRDNSRKHGMGIGAFNLITRQAYEALGTHRAIAMRPDDDLQLGIAVKRSGFRQRVLAGKRVLQVEWYPTLRNAVSGLEKNLFAGFGYSLLQVTAGVLGQLLFFVFPWLGLLLTGGWRAAAFAVAVIVQIMLYRRITRVMTGRGGEEAYLLPVGAALLVFVIVRSVGLALRRGGVMWRGTFYSLRELRGKPPR
ncbi:glycosyltransferase [Paenibacillus athensensis]|uniref:4,4'-diaponeurosporenoate glycosyltransferase n=1 Tax=Paenibacillus athensensis TaxID=1967502 RepID=A0A4Y8Q0B4_9BACL|nr:glycosyltransferase family 2 protein [Paenibacillus athensensis]MCD1261134.1 glycosyltransferase [Paenibacillus athensensis]